MDMANKAPEIHCTPEELAEIEEMEKSSSKELATRAKIIELANAGWQNTEIAKHINLSTNTVGKWRMAFADRGMDSIRPKERPSSASGKKHRNRSWSHETIDLPTTGKALIAVYASSTEQIAVTAGGCGVRWDGIGCFTTRNRDVGLFLDPDERISIEDTLVLSKKHARKPIRISAGDSAAFLEDLLARLPRRENVLYHVIVHSAQAAQLVHEENDLHLFEEEDTEHWIDLVCKTLPRSFAGTLKPALTAFLDNCRGVSAPFVWTQKLPDENREPLPEVPEEAFAAFQQAYQELLQNGSLRAEDGDRKSVV